MARNNRKASTTRRLHRWVGAWAAVFVLFMVVSGLAINHSNQLGLDQRYTTNQSLLSWYGLGKPQEIRSFAVGDNWVSFAGSQIYLNGRQVSTVTHGVGAVTFNNVIVAAGSDELLLLDNKGNLIERIGWSTPSRGPINSIGLLDDGIVAVRSMGQLWQADTELLSWQRSADSVPGPVWSISAPAPEDLQKAIIQNYSGGLILEQLLLDIHSGRIFGTIGILIYDLLALAVGFLAISGLILWVRGRRNAKRNGNR